MEIQPGVGVDQVRIGDRREDVEQRVGPPVHAGRSRRAVYDTEPALVISYTAEQRVEWETEVRSLYNSMVRIVVKPSWAKMIDFHETLPSAVEELVRRRQERQQP